jgi:hypothetical protein
MSGEKHRLHVDEELGHDDATRRPTLQERRRRRRIGAFLAAAGLGVVIGSGVIIGNTFNTNGKPPVDSSAHIAADSSRASASAAASSLAAEKSRASAEAARSSAAAATSATPQTTTPAATTTAARTSEAAPASTTEQSSEESSEPQGPPSEVTVMVVLSDSQPGDCGVIGNITPVLAAEVGPYCDEQNNNAGRTDFPVNGSKFTVVCTTGGEKLTANGRTSDQWDVFLLNGELSTAPDVLLEAVGGVSKKVGQVACDPGENFSGAPATPQYP